MARSEKDPGSDWSKSEETQAKQAVNACCPMDEEEIDPADLSPEQTRTFKGQTVGFCCDECAKAWDDLEDDERQDKLDDVTAVE